MADVRLIAAIGKRGQIGLNGRLPWDKEIGDLPWFKEQTRGHVVLVGRRTAAAMPKLDDREIAIWSGHGNPEAIVGRMGYIAQRRIIFIAGGAHTYAAFAPLCTKFIITRVDYDGPADAWFDPAWLCVARETAHG